MGFFQKIAEQGKQASRKIQNLYQKDQWQDDAKYQNYSYCNIDENNDMLRSSLKFSAYAPLIVESYIFLYGIYAFYTMVKTIILAPIQLILGILNSIFRSLRLYKSTYVTMHSSVVIAATYVFTLNEDIFDISFMYHLIRGQSTVKVYAIIFALGSSEIVLTKLGVFLHENIQSKLTDKDIPFYKLFPEFMVQLLYVFCHAYIIYIDFLIYSVVLNSSLESFIIFWSVVYLTKMKSVPTFGLDVDKYKVTLTDDSKYRFSRIIYLILFLLSQPKISIPSFGYKFIFIIFVEEAFLIIKHMLYLLSSYKGANDTSAIKIRQEMYQTMFLDKQIPSIDRCVKQNFTVLPFAVFCIKIIQVAIYSNWQPNFLAFLTYYVILSIFAGLLFILIILIKSIQQAANKMKRNNKQSSNVFLNSICINVMQNLINNLDQDVNVKRQTKQRINSQKKSNKNIKTNHQNMLPNPLFKIKKTTSIFQKLLIHADQIRDSHSGDNEDQIIRNTSEEDECFQDELDNNLVNKAKCNQSVISLKKSKSHS